MGEERNKEGGRAGGREGRKGRECDYDEIDSMSV